VNGIAHFADDVVASEGYLDAKSDFFEKLAIRADGCDAEVGTAEIDSNGKVGHGQKGNRKSLPNDLVEASQTREFIASPRTRGFARLAVILFDSAKGKLGSGKMRPRQ
jgi:hypothetical protein